METSAPLKPAVLHILLALAERDRHGYAIMQAVRDQSGGHLRLHTGSLYRHLSKLIDLGLVSEAPPSRRAEDPRRGVDYRLTSLGRHALERERAYLANVMAVLRTLRLAPRKGSL